MLFHIGSVQFIFHLCCALSVWPRLLLLRRRCWGRRGSWKRPVRSWHRSDNSSTSSCQVNSERMRTKQKCWLPFDQIIHHLIFAFRTQMNFSIVQSIRQILNWWRFIDSADWIVNPKLWIFKYLNSWTFQTSTVLSL